MVIDTNLLALLVVGLASPEYIRDHKRLDEYSLEEFSLLTHLLQKVKELIITSHVVAETYSLVRQIDESKAIVIAKVLGDIVCQHGEHHFMSCKAFSQPEFDRLGFTDLVLLAATSRRRNTRTLLTDDSGLHRAALARNLSVINFARRRDGRL